MAFLLTLETDKTYGHLLQDEAARATVAFDAFDAQKETFGQGAARQFGTALVSVDGSAV